MTGYRVGRGPMLPAAFTDIQLPLSPNVNATATVSVAPYLANEVVNYLANLSATTFAPVPYLLPGSTPLVPVALVDKNGELTNQTSQKALLLQTIGVPLPSGYTSTGSSDSPATFYVPDFSAVRPDNGQTINGMLWDLFRLVPAGTYWDAPLTSGFVHSVPSKDPRSQGFAWECQNAMRLLDLAHNPGHAVNRFTTTSPTNNPAQFALCENSFWGATATGLPLLPLMILYEDVQQWVNSGETIVPPHALGLASVKHPPRYVWPAQNRDGSIGIDNTSPVVEGMRLWMPRSVPVPAGMTTIGRMVFRQAQEYGFVIWDHSANVAIRTEQTIPADFYGGVNGVHQLDNFPWSSLQVLDIGSDSNPNPTLGFRALGMSRLGPGGVWA